MKYLLPLIFLFSSCVKMQEHPIFSDAKAGQEYLVKFKNQNDAKLYKTKRQVKTKAMERSNDAGFFVMELDEKGREAIKGKAEWVVPNATFSTNTWATDKIGVPAVHNSGNKGTQSVYVGVIDEGIMYWHPDLCQNVWVNPFDPVDGVDNDGNGYVDDKNGWDFVHNDNGVFDQLDNHGTHVSGTIASSVGVTNYATLISLKFLESTGSLENAIKAIDYLTDLKIRHRLNIVASNNSWGSAGTYQPLNDAINRANNADILFICAAGNNSTNIDITPISPASIDLPNVITVGASTTEDAIDHFSNFGSKVEIYAPGRNITSTVFVPTAPYYGYANYTGTSMAAPHVTGAAVLYKGLHPEATGQQVKNAILNSVRTVNGVKILDVSSFTGAVNPNVTTKDCTPTLVDVTPPTTIQNLRAVSNTSSSITMTWDAPYDLTGVAYLRLHVRGDMADGTTGHIYNFWGWYTSWNVPGLKANTWYRFRMVADDKYYNRSDSSNVAWGYTGTTQPPPDTTTNPPADTRSISLSGSASGRQHTLNWTVNGSNPNSFQIRNNTGLIGTVGGTVRNFSTMALKKGGNVAYTVTGIWPDRSISSNTVNLKIGR